MYWNLIDEKNKDRLKLIKDVLGEEGEEDRLDWDDIVACREQTMVAQWLKGEINDIMENTIGSIKADKDEALLEEISVAIRLDKIPSPCTIYHIAAAYKNIPVYSFFVELGIFGQDVQYDAGNIDHAKNGRLPWEVAVGADPPGIGVFAKKAYLKWIHDDEDDEEIVIIGDD